MNECKFIEVQRRSRIFSNSCWMNANSWRREEPIVQNNLEKIPRPRTTHEYWLTPACRLIPRIYDCARSRVAGCDMINKIQLSSHDRVINDGAKDASSRLRSWQRFHVREYFFNLRNFSDFFILRKYGENDSRTILNNLRKFRKILWLKSQYVKEIWAIVQENADF